MHSRYDWNSFDQADRERRRREEEAAERKRIAEKMKDKPPVTRSPLPETQNDRD